VCLQLISSTKGERRIYDSDVSVEFTCLDWMGLFYNTTWQFQS